jgi:acetyl esterase/lipase
MTRILLCLAILAAPAIASSQDKAKAKAPAPPEVPAGVVYEPDIVYGKGGDTELMLDIARPEKLDKPAPCVVFIHGGGWAGGHRKVHVPQILDFAKRGYVTATVTYRLVPKAIFPAQVEDVKCAIRYLRASADKHKLNPDKIGAVGFSAGAHLSMLLGTMDKKDGLEGEGGHAERSSKVQAVVAYFGPTDLAAEFPAKPFDVPKLIHDFLGGTATEKAAAYKAASPITYVDKNDAPTLIYHGTQDALVPYSQATLMTDLMHKSGMPGRVELILNANHGWGGTELVRTVEGTAAFFAEHLK